MSIFLKSVLESAGHTSDNFDVPVYEGYVNPETEGLSEIAQEALLENYQIQSSLMIMDAVNYSRVTEGHESIVTESAVKSVFQKMKEAWLKFWSKVTAWFKTSIENIKAYFTEGTAFVKKYKNDLLRVDVKGHSYKGYKWDERTGFSKSAGFDTKLHQAAGQANKDFPIINPDVEADTVTVTEYMEDTVFKGLGVENINEMKQAINESYRNGDTKPEEIENMSAVSVADMVKHVEGVDKIVKELERARKELEKSFKDAVKNIDTAAKEAEKAGKKDDMTTESGRSNNKVQSRIVSNASALDSVLKNIQTSRLSIITTNVQNLKSMSSEFVRVLKGIRNYRPVKESTVQSDDLFSAVFENMKY